jgi:predicted metal-dependent hydrolase
MIQLVIAITLVIIILSFLLKYETANSELTYVTSTIDNRQYLVRNLPDKQKAADMLANIRKNLTSIVEYLKENYIADERVQLLVNRFNPDVISESLPNTSYTSYSVDKGKKIVFCIRSKDAKQELIDMNTIMFVAIHELAHVMTKSVGHTEEFWDNMRYLLKKGIKIGVYTKVDYRKNPVKYCGIEILNSPLDNDKE